MTSTKSVWTRSAAVALFVVSAGLASASPATDDIEFAPAELYPVGSTPIGVTVADINGDGAPDVVCANGDLSLLVNNGDGTLATEVRLSVGGGGPRNVAVGDLDGDGNADLVASIQSGAGTIAVFLAESAGEFAPAVQYGVTNHSFALVTDDLDNDDDLDVAVVAFGGFGVTVSVFSNAGDGTFLPADVYDVFEAPIVYTAELAAADVDGDGLSDLIVVNDCPVGCDAAMAIMINAGDGSFLRAQPLDLAAIPVAVRAVDLDGDRDADLALVDCVSSGSDLVIALNDGAGEFAAHSRSPTDRLCSAGSVTTPDGIALFDVDGDGAVDAILPSLIGDEVRVLRNRGDLTFEPSIGFAVGERPIAVAVGDLDADGREDVVSADMAIGGQPTVAVLINQTDACPADLNDDGVVDTLDFLLFLGAWAQGDTGADWDGDGTVNTLDFLAYLNDWVAGC